MAQAARGEVYTAEEAARFYDQRIAAGTTGKGLMHYLVNAPDVPEEPPKT